MSNEISAKLTDLETLFSEQEYTIQTLNEIVSRQDGEIRRMSREIRWLKQELILLKEQIPDVGERVVDEVPPHY